MTILSILSALGLAAMPQIQAQAPARALEVASVRPIASDSGTSRTVRYSGRSINARASLAILISVAYQTEGYRLSGLPSWGDSQFYEVAAKAEGDGALTDDQFRQVLQTLLADRFQLKFHREVKEIPVYALVIDKNGPKVETSAPDAVYSRKIGRGQLSASRYQMTAFAGWLTRQVGRRVVDLTGLTGFYEVQLEWTPDQTALPDHDGAAPLDSGGPSIFTALREQLGLKLESRKNHPIEMLIIDHAEKPGAN